MTVKLATGGSIQARDLAKTNTYRITDFGASSGADPEVNTRAINGAVQAAHAAGGGTVVIPAGEFKSYTIQLKSNVNLQLEKDGVLRAARTDIRFSYEKQVGEGGNYEEPEVCLYAGLQDHGHSYFANSLIYGADLENVMIYGEGLIDGSCLDEETGLRQYVLQGGDPPEPLLRTERGHRGEWFGNKAIALVRCKNVVLSGFNLVIGGHFAIIAEGVVNMRVEHLLVDTTRDAIDIDCCQDVTVVHSTFNSLTDDALVLKASYGAGLFMPTKNVLIEDCVVSGYDAGSVYAGLYSRNKLIATDRCGPTGRVKLGTESTCGYEQVTIRRVRFDRSRGFALEAVDGSDLKDILFTDSVMDNVSSSPIFIRAGERGRFPVTGNSREELLVAGEGNVRLDNPNWVLPDTDKYQKYPPRRYTPSYRRDQDVTVDGHSSFTIVNQKAPARINEANLVCRDGVCYERPGDDGAVTGGVPLKPHEVYHYANASGSDHIARIRNIEIRNITITNADPRYPMLIMGLADSPIENVCLKNVSVSYRGGMKMEHAVEQRQLNTNWEYTQYQTAGAVQALPWLVNTFFLKNEGLLPRVDWDKEKNCWKEDPYNVPEMPGVYPEPSNWGILPAYGLYARHGKNLQLENVTMTTMIGDERHALVLEDVKGVRLKNVSAASGGNEPSEGVAFLTTKEGAGMPAGKPAAKVALVTNYFTRSTNREYVPGEPYRTTRVENLVVIPGKIAGSEADQAAKPGVNREKISQAAGSGGNREKISQAAELSVITEADIVQVTVDAPAPGTPPDDLYSYPTVPIPENGYTYRIPTEAYPLPLTVHRPFFESVEKQSVKKGEMLRVPVVLKDPATQISEREGSGFIYNEKKSGRDYLVGGADRSCGISLESSLPGAVYEEVSRCFVWDTADVEPGSYEAVLSADDGLLKEYGRIYVEVLK